MKILKRIALFIIAFLLFMNYTRADDCTQQDLIGDSTNFRNETNLFLRYTYGSGGSNDFQFLLYRLKSKSNDYFYAYCMEAGKHAKPDNTRDTRTFTCRRKIFDVGSGHLYRNIHDAGIIEIFRQGYSSKSNNKLLSVGGKKLTEAESYAATTLALRVYTMYFPDVGYGSYSSSSLNLHEPFQNYANKWYNSLKDLVEKANGSKTFTKFKKVGTSQTWKLNDKTDITDLIDSAAKDLVKKGLEAAIAFRANPVAASIKVTRLKENSNSRDSETDLDTGLKTYIYNADYKIEINDFKSDVAYVKFKFSCPDCAANNVDYEIFLNGQSYGKTFPADMLKDTNLVTDGSGDINMKIKFTANEDDYDCSNLKYYITYEYTDETLAAEVYDYKAQGCPNCQHFYVLFTEDKPIEESVDKNGETLNLCYNESCDDLKKKCDGGDSKSCEKFTEKCGSENNTECSPYVGNAQCSSDPSEFDIAEEYEGQEPSCVKPQDPNIKKCVIEKTDVNENSYQDTSLVSNNYCKVYCKEDYHFTMPGDQHTTSVRYLELKAGIKGTKSCYTVIDRDAFLKDYEETRKQLIKTFNDYNFYTAMSKATGQSTYHSGYYLPSHPYHDYEVSEGELWHYPERTDANFIDPWFDYTSTWSTFDMYDPDAESVLTRSTDTGDLSGLPAHIECQPVGGQMRCRYNSPGNDGNYTHHMPLDFVYQSRSGTPFNASTYASQANNSKSRISSYIKKLNLLVKQINQCSTWEMNYHYDPKIYFDYEEDYMNHILSNTLEPVSEVKKDSLKVSKCTKDTTDDYFKECPEGWRESGSASNSADLMEKLKKVVVTDSLGIEVKEIEVSKVISMKEELKVEAEYQIPTQYSNLKPTGGIVETEDPDIPNGKLLEHLLPVGTSAQGYYTFALIVEDLGEYFGTNKLGRVWGDEESVYKKTIQLAPACYGSGGVKVDYDGVADDYSNGVYSCRYSVNIPECDPDPDYKCDPNCPNDPDCPDEPGDNCNPNSDGTCDPNCPDDPDCPGGNPGGCDPNPDGKCDRDCPNDPDCIPQCPDCPVVCPPDGPCYYDDSSKGCPPNKCPVACPTCVYNNGLNVQNRPITPDDVDPNDRDLGANWNSGLDSKYPDTRVNVKTSLQLKAYATTKEIVEDSNTIYDVEENNSGLVSNNYEDLAVLVDLNSRMIRDIQSYNKTQEDKGGYANSTLECYDYELNGKKYENVFCYSTFIDELIDKYGDSRIKFSIERPDPSSREGHPDGTHYFTTWERASGTMNWNVSTSTSLDVFTNNFGYDREKGIDYGIGPSWK